MAEPARHRTKNRLSIRFVETVKRPGFYADGNNLYLDFKDPPAKSWVLRYKRDGRARDHGLGPYRCCRWPKPASGRSTSCVRCAPASTRSIPARPSAKPPSSNARGR